MAPRFEQHDLYALHICSFLIFYPLTSRRGFTFGSKAIKRNINLEIDDDKSTSEIEDDTSNADIEDAASIGASIGPATSPKPSASMNVENDDDQGRQTVANSKTQQQATARSDTLIESSKQQSGSLLENLSFNDSASSSQSWKIDNTPLAVGKIEKAHETSDKNSITTDEPFSPTGEKSNDLVLTLETIAGLSKGDRLCWKCMGEVQNDWIACKHCGTDLFKKKCGNCGNPIKSDWYFHPCIANVVIAHKGLGCSSGKYPFEHVLHLLQGTMQALWEKAT